MDSANPPAEQTWPRRIAVGILSAVALYCLIYYAGSVATGLWEKEHGVDLVYGDSPLWVVLWGGLLGVLLWKGKPRLLDVIVPFTLAVGFAYLQALATFFHPDTTEQIEAAFFSKALFLACFGVWGLGLLLALVRWIISLFKR